MILCNKYKYDCMLMTVEPAILIPIKTELKEVEEAIVITRAETISARPTIGMSCHSISLQ